MGVWVWLRSVNVWSTLFLSAFHLQTLRRVAPTIGNFHGPRGVPTTLLLSLGLIWLLNFIYSIPAHVFSTNGNENSTEVRACCNRYEYIMCAALSRNNDLKSDKSRADLFLKRTYCTCFRSLILDSYRVARYNWLNSKVCRSSENRDSCPLSSSYCLLLSKTVCVGYSSLFPSCASAISCTHNPLLTQNKHS